VADVKISSSYGNSILTMYFLGSHRSISLLAALLCVAIALPAVAQRKKKKEEETQTLQIPKELPAAVSGDPRHFTFHTTPLSSKGLLSQQIRDALKALTHLTGSDTVLHLRAFAAGSGDLRRVRDLVSEVFTDRHQSLPSLSLIQSGGLPMEGSQVVLESVSAARKEVNPSGLVWISAMPAVSAGPTDPIAPLTEKSLGWLRQALHASGSEASDVLRVTCFFSSLDDLAGSRKLVEAVFPRAALNYVQTQRAPFQAMAACEAVARLRIKPAEPLRLQEVEGLPNEPGASHLALVAAPSVILTGTQVSYGYEEQNSRLALERLRKALEQAGANARDAAVARYYPLSGGIANQVRKIRGEVFNAARPPAGSLLVFEGLPSMDAGFAVDAVVVKR
jgi:enamine deaminase RidA (YjgF/YER057c/UK114 family)